MKVRLILIGMAAGLVLPLAAPNAGAVVDPGLNRAGAGADLERGAAPTAENFGRQENEDNQGNKCDKGDKGDKCHRCDDGDHSDKGDKGEDCEKSPSKPH